MPWKSKEIQNLCIKEVERAARANEVGLRSIRNHCALYWIGIAVGVDPFSIKDREQATGLNDVEDNCIASNNDMRGLIQVLEYMKGIPCEESYN